MSDYKLKYHAFKVDERGLAEALGLNYDEVLKDRETAQEERAGIHGPSQREMREALDALERETLRRMLGLR